MADPRFAVVGIREPEPAPPRKQPWYAGKPVLSLLVLGLLLAGCLLCGLFTAGDPGCMDLAHCSASPGRDFRFGTDAMGRDVFTMLWYGGRVSLAIGFAAAGVSTVIAVAVGTVSGLAPRWLDHLVMRLTELFLSIPSLLTVVLLQSIWGTDGVFGLSLVIGAAGWPAMAKVVQTEVRRLRHCGYMTAARCMGGGFFHNLRRHLAPNFFSSILFMIVMSIRTAMVTESTLSFMGMGLPLEVISWGSILSLSEKALLSGAWWVILFPGVFLIVTLLCVTNIGNCLRENTVRSQSNL